MDKIESPNLYTKSTALVGAHGFNRRIGLDFDGCICGNTIEYVKTGTEIEVTRKYVQRLREAGYYIVIYSGRTNTMTLEELLHPSGGYTKLMHDMVKWLRDTDFPFDEIWIGEQKPPCITIIDDRVFRFDENKPEECWKGIYSSIVDE